MKPKVEHCKEKKIGTCDNTLILKNTLPHAHNIITYYIQFSEAENVRAKNIFHKWHLNVEAIHNYGCKSLHTTDPYINTINNKINKSRVNIKK